MKSATPFFSFVFALFVAQGVSAQFSITSQAFGTCSEQPSFNMTAIPPPGGAYQINLFYNGNLLPQITGSGEMIDSVCQVMPGVYQGNAVIFDSNNAFWTSTVIAPFTLGYSCTVATECLDGETILIASNGEVSYHIGASMTTTDTLLVNESSFVEAYTLYGSSVFADQVLDTCATTSVGIGDLTATPAVSVYPNPATDEVTLVAPGCDTYQVYDILGRTVASGVIAGESVAVNLQGLQSGQYIVQVSSSGSSFPTKLIVR